MSELTFPIICIGIFAIFMVIILYHEYEQRQIAESQLIKLIKQLGGQNVEVRLENVLGTRGVMHFVVTYYDMDGKYRTRRVSRKLSFWGSLEDDFYWEEPLSEVAKNSSKEQLISDMDAEIKRLQKELEQARINNSQ